MEEFKIVVTLWRYFIDKISNFIDNLAFIIFIFFLNDYLNNKTLKLDTFLCLFLLKKGNN